MKPKTVVNLGVIGFGYIARRHVQAYQRHINPKVSLSAVCDKNPEAEKLVKRELPGARFYSDPDAMLKHENLDLVHISTPPLTHAFLSILCMEKGCHVAVEKPMATTVKDCDHMIQVMKDKALHLFILHTSLYNPAFLRLKGMIGQGEVGEIFGVDLNFLGNSEEPFIIDANHWSHSLPGGAFCESLPHPLYLLQSLLPKLDVEAVFWQKRSALKHLVADDLCGLFKGDSASATLRMGWDSPRNMAIVRVYGTKAIVDCDLHSLSVIKHKPGTVSPLSLGADNLATSFSLLGSSVSGFLKWTAKGWRGSYQTLIPKILENLAGEGPSPVNVEDAREVVRLMEQICSKITPARA